MNVPATDRVDQRIAAVGRTVPGYAGYARPEGRRESDRLLRLGLARRVRSVRDLLATRQRQATMAGSMQAVVAIETLLTRLGRLTDRLESAGARYGTWFGDRQLVTPVMDDLVDLDRALSAGVEALASAAQAIDVAGVDWGTRLRVLDDLTDDLHARFELRGALLVSAQVPARDKGQAAPVPEPSASADLGARMLGAVYPGDRLTVEGRERVVTGRTVWQPGDIGLTLGDPMGRLRLWQAAQGPMVLFEGQLLDVPLPPPDPLELGGQHFRRRWADSGAALATGPGSQEPGNHERWVYEGDAGSWLWVERVQVGGDKSAARCWRGTVLDPDEVTPL